MKPFLSACGSYCPTSSRINRVDRGRATGLQEGQYIIHLERYSCIWFPPTTPDFRPTLAPSTKSTNFNTEYNVRYLLSQREGGSHAKGRGCRECRLRRRTSQGPRQAMVEAYDPDVWTVSSSNTQCMHQRLRWFPNGVYQCDETVPETIWDDYNGRVDRFCVCNLQYVFPQFEPWLLLGRELIRRNSCWKSLR